MADLNADTRAWRISETAAYIIGKGFTIVTLQLPDELLHHATNLAGMLQKECVSQRHSVQIYVLADTTYNSLSVDEVAAQHVGAQCVIHYGRASMTKLSRLPAYFVFPEEQLDAQAAARSLASSPLIASSRRALIFLDQPLLHAQPQLQSELAQQQSTVEVTFAEVPTRQLEPQQAQQAQRCAAGGPSSTPTCCQSGGSAFADEPATTCAPPSKLEQAAPPEQQPADAHPLPQESHASEHPRCGASSSCAGGANHPMLGTVAVQQSLASPLSLPGSQLGPEFEGSQQAAPGRHSVAGYGWELPAGVSPAQCCLVWVGAEDAPALVQLQMTYSSAQWVVYDPQRGCQEGLPMHISRALRKRYYLVEKARVASIVGILVGTLGVAGYRDAMQRVRQAAHQAGKKTYTLLMGKPSPAKLANFPEIEVFVMIADPQGQILDSKEFLSPIITPYEAMLAFSQGGEWDASQYRLDFDGVVGRTPQGGQGEEMLHHSLFDGRLHQNNTGVAVSDGGSALALKAQEALQITTAPQGRSDVVAVKSAADYYVHRRTWLGVETPLVGSEAKAVEQAATGRTGRAAGYVDEPSKCSS